MKLQIVGSGVVGQATGRGLHAKGHDVTFVDINAEVLHPLRRDGYNVSTSLVEEQEATLISVPTPTRRGRIITDYIESASKSVGRFLSGNEYQVVVVRSTVPPGTVEDVVLPILEDTSGLTAGRDFGVCMNPEFLIADTANEDFLNAKSFIVGEYDIKSGDVMEEMFRPWNVPVVRMPIKAAELVKYTSNVFGALKITYFNIIGKVAEGLGMDVEGLVETVADHSHVFLNPRYGIYPGQPYGGACFPKDTMAFIEYLRSNGTSEYAPLFEAMHKINHHIADELRVAIPEYAEV